MQMKSSKWQRKSKETVLSFIARRQQTPRINRETKKGTFMPTPDSPPDAEKLWAEMLDSVRSVLDTVQRTIAKEQYKDSLKEVMVESMQLALAMHSRRASSLEFGRTGHWIKLLVSHLQWALYVSPTWEPPEVRALLPRRSFSWKTRPRKRSPAAEHSHFQSI